jgi:hypothetical protein
MTGVKHSEMILSSMIAQMCVLAVQVALLLAVMLGYFQIPNHGSVSLIALTCFVQGICGVSFGIVIATLAGEDILLTVVASLGVFLPIMFIGGTCPNNWLP